MKAVLFLSIHYRYPGIAAAIFVFLDQVMAEKTEVQYSIGANNVLLLEEKNRLFLE